MFRAHDERLDEACVEASERLPEPAMALGRRNSGRELVDAQGVTARGNSAGEGRWRLHRRWGAVRWSQPLWACCLWASFLWVCFAAVGAESAKDAVPPVPKGDLQLTKDAPFKENAAGPSVVAPGGNFQLRFTVHVLDTNHYLYKEMMNVVLEPVPGLAFGEVKFSRAPETKFDQFEERNREIYHSTITMYVDGKVDPKATLGPRTVNATVKYQGCNPSTCFMPAKKKQTLSLEVSNKQADAGAAAEPSDPVDPVEEEPKTLTAAAVPPAAGGSDPGAGPTGGNDGNKPSTEAAAPAEAASSSAAVSSTVSATLPASVPVNAAAVVAPASQGPIDFSRGLLWTFLAVFGMGILASFTPCVYPIIPITVSVLGARQAGSRLHGFFLALVYVIGLSVTYTLLGVFAAQTGALFGGIMQNVYVLSGISVLFIGMGFGMLGAFDVTMPSGVTNRLAGVKGRGFPGAFVMGAIAGLVASPCIGPLIVSLLTYIAQTGNVALGAALMFTFALGMGQLFLVLGTFAINLPRSGAWMEKVKGGLALMLFGVGLYYLSFVIPPGYYELLLGASLLLAGVFVGAFDGLTEEATTGARINKGLGLLMVLVGMFGFLGGMVQTRLIAPEAIAMVVGSHQEATVQVAHGEIAWKTDYEASIAEARASNKPVMIDFSAEWCAACKELEKETFPDPQVVNISKEFVAIRVDGTEDTPLFVSLKEKYGILGLPYVVFIDREGKPLPELTITGFVPPEDLRRRMCQVGVTGSKELADVCRS